MDDKKIDEIFQFKIKGIVDLPIGGIIVEKTMDLNKNETEVKIRLKYEIMQSKKEA